MQLIVHDLPHLSFINLLWYPSSDREYEPHINTVLGYRTTTENLLQAAATNTSTCRTIVAFAQPMLFMDGGGDEEIDWPKRKSFTGVRLHGLSQILAKRVKGHLEYLLPDSKIVNYRFAGW